MNIIIMGLPGAGKGTQAVKIIKKHSIPHISTGDMFRLAIKNETDLGKQAKAIIDHSKHSTYEIKRGIVKERLSQSDTKGGFQHDRFPKTIEQAEDLNKIMEDLGSKNHQTINIDVPEEELMKRLTGRR